MPAPAPAAPSAGELKDILISNQVQFAALQKTVTELNEAIKNGSEEAAKTKADLQQQITILTQPDGRRPVPAGGLSKEDVKNFSYIRAVRYMHSKDAEGCEHERDVFKRGAQCRAMAGGTDTAGGYWLPPELSGDFIELLRPRLVLQELGASIETGVSGSPYEITGQAGGATAVMIGENSSITESQLAAKMLKATPHMVGAFVKAPLGFINRASSPNAEQKIKADMAAAVARMIELQALQGNGQGANCLGLQGRVAEAATVGPPGLGEEATWQNLVRLRGKVMDANVQHLVNDSSAGYLTTDKSSRAYILQGVGTIATAPEANQFSAYGNPILTLNDLSAKLGTKFLTTNALAEVDTNKPPVWFGIWSELVIPIWGQVMLSTSDVAGDAFQNVQIVFRAVAEFDVLPRYTEAFAWKRVNAAGAL